MSLFKTAATTFIEALFPVSPAEREIMAMGADTAFRNMPRAERSPVPEACAVFSYKDERVRRLVWSVKYKRSALGASIAGYALHQVVRLCAVAAPQVVIVPMPITARRRHERGFNQCELMADEIERFNELDASQHADARSVVARDLLVRKVHASRQTLKDRAERLESIKDIFAINDSAAQKVKKEAMVVVIDDVITTGSTIKDAVSTLRQAGFEKTWGLSVAH